MIKDTEKINVLNYNENRVSVMVSPTTSFSFEPSSDGKTPTVIPMAIEQIRYANNFNTFKGGFLFFEKEKEADVYETLGIDNWQDILHNEDIKEILINPTFDGLNKLISIKDGAVFERVRAVFHKLKQSKSNDISIRVAQIINARYKELQNRKVNTSIILEKRDIPVRNDEEVEALRAENKAMQEQLAEMQEMMKKLMSQSEESTKTTKKTSTRKTATNSKKTETE